MTRFPFKTIVLRKNRREHQRSRRCVKCSGSLHRQRITSSLLWILSPLAEQLLGAEINKIPHTLVCGILCFRYTIDEHTSCRSGSDQLQNQARFCKMFSLPHGSRRRICPDRLLQNRSDTAGRFYSYDILKNCTFARGKQCTICSVVYCKRREYVVLFLIRKMDSIFGVSLKFIAYSILNVFSGGT